MLPSTFKEQMLLHVNGSLWGTEDVHEILQ